MMPDALVRQPERPELRFRDDLHACPRCGAHRWEQDARMVAADVVRCGECNGDQQCADVLVVAVGRD